MIWSYRIIIWGMLVLLSISGSGQVLISEIMYHPEEIDLPFPDYDDRERAEFIEIWNSGSVATDISLYSFDGISYCFPPGTTLNPNQRIVLAKDSTVFANEYGFSAFGVYNGSLSNNGETLLLFNQLGQIQHTVSYNDRSNWPVNADGLGNSLELFCSSCDVSLYSNWGASNGHTAGAPNNAFLSGNLPNLDSISISDSIPAPGQQTTISVQAMYETTVVLEYSINFGSTQTITGTFNNGMYEFTLPGFASGDLINFQIIATNALGSFSLPRSDDALPYYTYAVENTAQVSSNFPVIDWYYDATSPDSALTTLVYEGQVISNAFAWWRRNKHWRVDLPKGQEFSMDGYTTLTVDEFQLNRPDHGFHWWVNGTMARTAVFTNMISESGEPKLDAFNVRVDENGQYGKIWTFLTWPDGNWRDHVGIVEGHEYYKFPSTTVPGIANPEIKYPKGGDDASVYALIALADSVGPHLMDVYDIPGMVNFAALSTLICHWDAGLKNFYMHKHPNGRWEGDIWDVDAAPRTGIVEIDSFWCKCAELPGMAPGVNYPNGNPIPVHPNNDGNMFAKPLIANNTRVRDMYYRRLRTLIDKYYAPGELMGRVMEQADSTDPDILYTAATYSANHNIAEHQKNIYVDYPAWQLPRYAAKPGFPPTATGITDIIFNEIQYAPAGGDQEEFVELYNNSTESVDLTGWKIEGIGLEFPAGTVILPQDFLVVSSWSPSFIAAYGSGKYVAADFKGSRLNNNGETLRLLDTGGVVIDELTYQQTGWKGAHGGPSLERIDYNGLSDDPTNWAPSSTPNGTPDAPNSPDNQADYTPILSQIDLVINELMYHPAGLGDISPGNLDFVELIHTGMTVTDVSGVKVRGVDYEFPAGSLLQPGQIVVLAADFHSFRVKYGFEPYDAYDGKLDNSGETIEIISPEGLTIDEVTYNDKNPWDELPDGGGPSLELLHPTFDNADLLHWFRSDTTCGTPGLANSRTCNNGAQPIVINEINYNSDNVNSDPGDWIEFHNPNATPVNLEGWQVFDNNDVYTFPVNTILDAGAFLVLVEDEAMFTSIFPGVNNYIGEFTFSLSNKGERISLFNPDKCLSDYVVYDDRAPWDTIPDGNGPTLSLITPNSDNALAPSWEASSAINAPLGTPGRANEPCPAFTITAPAILCMDDSILIHTNTNDQADFVWTIQGGTPATATGDSIYVVFQNPGLAVVDLQYTYFECIGNEQELYTIDPCNTAPISQSDNFIIDEDSTLMANVLTNDSDPQNHQLSASLVTNVLNGTLTLNADGSFTYLPFPDYFGSDNFIYEVCDNGSPVLCVTELVNIVINSINDAPVTTTDVYNTNEDQPVSDNVLTNDSDVDGNQLTTTLFSQPVFGTVALQSNGDFAYTPNQNYSGSDNFVYEVCDDGTPSICLTEIVSITIAPVNDPPVSTPDFYSVNEDNSINGDVLSNDSDVENQPIESSLVTNVLNGSLTLNLDGTFTYTPNPNYFGIDSFLYKVCDNATPVLCTQETVIIEVLSVNDIPIVLNDTLSTDEGVQVVGDASINDFDVETSPMSYQLISFTQNGSVLFNFDGSFYYTPFPGFAGNDSFQYLACDNGTPNYCDTATVYIEVIPTCVTFDMAVLLEGAYDLPTNSMLTTLNTVRAVLPGMTGNPGVGQPYSVAPWNYPGTEGAGWADADYDTTVVDWVLVSFRTDVTKASELLSVAGIVHSDGVLEFPDQCVREVELSSDFYIVLEHRNHMAVMTPNKVSVVNRVITWDFRTADSYGNGGSGQKELAPGIWGMYAGDCNQIDDLVSYDINGKDKSTWLIDNGKFGVYLPTDINMNGDVNGADRTYWLLNNGVFGSVKK